MIGRDVAKLILVIKVLSFREFEWKPGFASGWKINPFYHQSYVFQRLQMGNRGTELYLEKTSIDITWFSASLMCYWSEIDFTLATGILYLSELHP